MYSVCNQILFYFIVEDFCSFSVLVHTDIMVLYSTRREVSSFFTKLRPKNCNKRTHFFFLASRVVESNLQVVWV